MTETPAGRAARPLSPHLQVWRWHLTMFCSIAHRATGVALYGGALLLAAWAVALAAGPEAYTSFKWVMGSLLGKLVLFGMTLSIFYHLANGVRHLVWDAGHGFEPKLADMTGAATLAFAVVATITVWAIAFFVGAI